MRNFDQLLESALEEAILSPNAELTHTEKNKRNRLEKALRAARNDSAGKSGMGERYDYALMRELRILQQVAKYRQLTERELTDVKWGEAARQRMYPRRPMAESDETRLLASVLQKLDAMPQQMPYNTRWTGIHVVVKWFGLTPDEANALANSKAWKKDKGGYDIERPNLVLAASRPDVPKSKQNLRRAQLAGVGSSRFREERGSYFESKLLSAFE